MKKYIIILIFSFAVIPSNIQAHSGRTDSSGGHNCRTGSCAGTYHYHNGGYLPTYSPYVAPKKTPTYSKQTKEVQQKLNKIYGYLLYEDGKLGSTTKNAIEKFQRDSKLSVTGSINTETIEALDDAYLNHILLEENKGDSESEDSSTLLQEQEKNEIPSLEEIVEDREVQEKDNNNTTSAGIGFVLVGAGVGYFLGKKKKTNV